MSNRSQVVLSEEPRVLMLSQRSIKDVVTGCIGFEFEDVIRSVDAVDLVTPTQSYVSSNKVFHQIRRVVQSPHLANALKPEPNAYRVDRDYDLLFVICQVAKEIPSISSLKGWQKRCKKAVCYILELWEQDIESCRPLLQLLREFDHIFLGHYHGTKAVAEIVGRPCTHLPFATDTIKFCPYPARALRSIDVSYIGRRSPITHAALLQLAEQQQIFYYYDTFKSLNIRNPAEHRFLYANLLKRTNYFIANQAKLNEVRQTSGQLEFGARFFEGAAAGTVMIGDYRSTAAFKQYFSWEDAVIQLPFDAPDIGTFLAELNEQPDRLARIRTHNALNSLRSHDWLHRWQTILSTVQLEPTPAMLSRQAQLNALIETGLSEPEPMAAAASICP